MGCTEESTGSGWGVPAENARPGCLGGDIGQTWLGSFVLFKSIKDVKMRGNLRVRMEKYIFHNLV